MGVWRVSVWGCMARIGVEGSEVEGSGFTGAGLPRPFRALLPRGTVIGTYA